MDGIRMAGRSSWSREGSHERCRWRFLVHFGPRLSGRNRLPFRALFLAAVDNLDINSQCVPSSWSFPLGSGVDSDLSTASKISCLGLPNRHFPETLNITSKPQQSVTIGASHGEFRSNIISEENLTMIGTISNSLATSSSILSQANCRGIVPISATEAQCLPQM